MKMKQRTRNPYDAAIRQSPLIGSQVQYLHVFLTVLNVGIILQVLQQLSFRTLAACITAYYSFRDDYKKYVSIMPSGKNDQFVHLKNCRLHKTLLNKSV